jgi:predicted GIY-YIG superfamily endonuclease
MVNIYILQLEDTSGGYKYYVGKSSNPIVRLEQHNKSNGSAWTNKYKPISIVELIPDCDDYDEDKYTLKYMKKYGIDNVRGGSFTQIKLDEDNIKTINKMIKGSTNKCYNCNSNDHYINQCNKKPNKTNEKLIKLIKETICERCERTGHSIDDCYASTDKNGEEILEYESDEIEVYCCDYCGKEFETAKGAQFHENVHCKKKFEKPEVVKPTFNIKNIMCVKCGNKGHLALNCNINKKTYTASKKTNKCFKCGRGGHYADDCYAEKHINGKYLD